MSRDRVAAPNEIRQVVARPHRLAGPRICQPPLIRRRRVFTLIVGVPRRHGKEFKMN